MQYRLTVYFSGPSIQPEDALPVRTPWLGSIMGAVEFADRTLRMGDRYREGFRVDVRETGSGLVSPCDEWPAAADDYARGWAADRGRHREEHYNRRAAAGSTLGA